MRAIILLFVIITICVHNGQTEHVISFNGENYYFSAPAEANWFAAQRKCHQLGYDLVEIENMELQTQLKKTIDTLDTEYNVAVGSSRWWIGGTNDHVQKTDFYWAGSGRPFTFTFWRFSEPRDSTGKENCVQIYTVHSTNFGWSIRECTLNFHFICGPKSK